MNSFCGVGRLARDPQVRFEESGSQAITFQLVISEPGKDGAVYNLYVGCESWGRVADQASTLSAEDVVAVEGRLKYRSFVDKKGEKRSMLCVLVRSLSVITPANVGTN